MMSNTNTISHQPQILLAPYRNGVIMLILLSTLGWANPNCSLESCTENDNHPTELSVQEKPLKPCSTNPMTGFYRDSYCRTGANDRGIHVVCATMNQEFLSFTKSKGNDLSSPAPQYGFPGLKVGDQWCLCAARWKEAQQAGKAPKVVLEATSKAALRITPLSLLKQHIQ